MNFSRVKVSNYLNVIQIWNRFLTQTIGSLSIALNSHLITHLEFNHSFYRLGTWKVHLKVPSSLLITFIEPHKIHLQKKPQAFKYQTSNNKRWRYFQYFDRIFLPLAWINARVKCNLLRTFYFTTRKKITNIPTCVAWKPWRKQTRSKAGAHGCCVYCTY